MASRFAAGHDRLNDQCSTMGQAMEQGRLQSRALSGLAKSQASKADNLEKDIRDLDVTLKETVTREKEAREEQLRSMYKNVLAQQATQLMEMENRMREIVERESESRSKSILQLLDDVGCVVEKEIPSVLRERAGSAHSPSHQGQHQLVQHVQIHGGEATVQHYRASGPPVQHVPGYQGMSIVDNGSTAGSSVSIPGPRIQVMNRPTTPTITRMGSTGSIMGSTGSIVRSQGLARSGSPTAKATMVPGATSPMHPHTNSVTRGQMSPKKGSMSSPQTSFMMPKNGQ